MTPMTVSEFKVTKGLKAYGIHFACPACDHPLRGEISDAGKTEKCPKCGSSFIVPGEEKRRQIEDRERERLRQQALEDQQRHLRAQVEVKANQLDPEQRAPSNPALGVPRYNELRWVADFLVAVGFVLVALGLLAVVYSIIVAISEESRVYLTGAVLGLAGSIIGVVVMAAGRTLHAIRDMAINSSHIRHSLERTEVDDSTT